MEKKVTIGQVQFKLKNMISLVDKTISQMEKIRYQLSKIEGDRYNVLPKCEKCGVRNVRMRQDKTYFCYTCGFDSKNEVTKWN